MDPCYICKDETHKNLQIIKWKAKSSQSGGNIICPYCFHNYFLTVLGKVSYIVFLGRGKAHF